MNRRQFLKGAAATAGLGAVSLLIRRDLTAGGAIAEEKPPAEPYVVGPKLLEGLQPAELNGTACALYEGETVLITDAEGLRLLRLADGTRTLDELMVSGISCPEAVADFYLALAQSGWLANRLEVTKYAVEA